MRGRNDRVGYAILTREQHYLSTGGEETLDVARAKVYIRKPKADEALLIAKARFTGATLEVVTLGVDSAGGLTINGFPREVLKSRRANRRAVWSRYGGRCAYCGVEVTLRGCHMDAYYPSAGMEPKNMMPACDQCYAHKRGKTPAQFEKYIEGCLNSVRKDYRYNTARRYGLIIEPRRGVSFYYLTPEAQNALKESKGGSGE